MTDANILRCLLMADDFGGVLNYWIKEYHATPTDLAVFFAVVHDSLWERGGEP